MRVLKAYKNMEPTFSELAKVLTALKFKNKSSKDYFVFINEKFDATVFLKINKEKNAVPKADFAVLSFILAEKEVIKDPFDIGKMIEKNREELKKIAV